ncbi:MAG TPA: ABC transporter ATP-binding protein [Longimicrobium sp.]|jgi:ABC-2 type transport system ATP-binding protein
MTPAIETVGLRKLYPPPRMPGRPPRGAPPPAEVLALDGLDLCVERGELFGVLGPNGAGKSTTLGILTTRVRPSGGSARVEGVDVAERPVEVRRRIGVVPQRPNPDRALSVVENLVFHAAYFGIPKAVALARAAALLDRLGIADRQGARTDALSGGQQQRLMIARALMHEPRVLFLDEPTAGLDPAARLALWDVLGELHAEGRTVVLATHYMEEADRLCGRVAVIDRGRVLAADTPERLKARAPGGTLVELALDGDAGPAAEAAAAVPGVDRAEARGPLLRAYSGRGGEVIPALIAAAEGRGRTVRDIHLARPSLETLFISLTGRNLAA